MLEEQAVWSVIRAFIRGLPFLVKLLNRPLIYEIEITFLP